MKLHQQPWRPVRRICFIDDRVDIRTRRFGATARLRRLAVVGIAGSAHRVRAFELQRRGLLAGAIHHG